MISLRRQRGFIYLTSGANGTGKTLFTLRDVRTLQLETGRAVYYNGFTAKQPLIDFGWLPFEPEKWQDLPDGSICIFDEVQKVLPLRAPGKPPEWIGAMSEIHRKRGFDFFMITQHPMNIDSFIRRIIASPGWHRHFKASTMSDSSNELKWAAVVDQPQKPGSGNTGEVVARKFDKEVYDWYASASLHTAKKKVPLKVWLAFGGLLVAALSIAYVARGLYGMTQPKDSQSLASVDQKPSDSGLVKAPASGTDERKVITPQQYVEAYTPRIQGLQHSAPAYDQLTSPKKVPVPAACISMGTRCGCFTQNGTPYDTTQSICEQIVKHGIFLPFEEGQAVAFAQRSASPAPVPFIDKQVNLAAK